MGEDGGDAVNPAEALEKMLPAWRAGLPADYAADFIDEFVARNQTVLLALVERALTTRRVKRGLLPRNPAEFAAYGKLVPRERARDAEPDDEVLRQLLEFTNSSRKAKDRVAREVAGYLYARRRAEAMVLRREGWDAVPMMVRDPALVIVEADQAIAVMDVMREVSVASGFVRARELRNDLAKIYKHIGEVSSDINEPRLERFALALWSRIRGAAPTPAVPAFETPPDERDRKWRTEANLEAMQTVLTVKPGELTGADLQKIARYSGWGGLSIESVQDRIPKELVPESFGLIHEYYTPTAIADAIVELLCPLLPELAGNDGVLRALEPSAGIGRLIRAFTPKRCLALEAGGQIKQMKWTAVEFSQVSARLLRALRPDIDLYHMPFERWARDEGPKHRGTYGLIVSNPPYGERGVMAREDTDKFYKEKRAYAYFMRRASDELFPGGIAVYLVPSGFMSGTLNRGLREKLLLRHHLLGAYRIPSHDPKRRETVPGASVVMDLIILRSRGGELSEIDEADHYIVDGNYFKQHPNHILGKEEGALGTGEYEAGSAKPWHYQVTGTFSGFPPLVPRPLCTSCVLTSIADSDDAGTFQTVVQDDAIPDDVEDDLRPALELGRRVGRYLAAVGADEADKAAQLWPELHTALGDFSKSGGNPWQIAGLRALAEKRKVNAAEQILSAFEKTGAITEALRAAPKITPRFAGPPDDVVGQAEALFRQQRSLTLAELMKFHRAQGGSLTEAAALETLLAADWNRDGDAWTDLLPADAYLTGVDLWARHDRAAARAARGDEQAKVQVKRLLEAIKPAVFDDLTEVSPQLGYVPLELVSAWLSASLNERSTGRSSSSARRASCR
jgi:hypothetical protein